MAITHAERRRHNTAGVYGETIYRIASGWADADIIVTRFRKIVSAEWTPNDASTVAADSVAPEILATDTTNRYARVRLQLAGTARAGTLTVKGY